MSATQVLSRAAWRRGSGLANAATLSLILLLLQGAAAPASAAQFTWDAQCLPNIDWHACCEIDVAVETSCRFPTCVVGQGCRCPANANNWDTRPQFLVPPACPDLPGPTDDVDLGAFNVEVTIGGVTVRNLSAMGLFSFNAATFTVTGAAAFGGLNAAAGTLTTGGGLTVSRDLNFFGGTLEAGGDMSVVGETIWRAGILRGSPVSLHPTTLMGRSLFDTTASKTIDGRTLINLGDITWLNGAIVLANGGRFENRSTLLDGASAFVTGNGPAVFSNEGDYDTVPNSGQTTFASAVEFNHSGRLTVRSGTAIRVEGSGTSTAAMSVDDGGLFEFAPIGNSVYSVNAADLDTSGSGFLRMSGNGMLSLVGTVNAGNFGLDAGSLSSGTLDARHIEWTGGTVRQSTVQARLNLNISGAVRTKIIDAGRVEHFGDGVWTNRGTILLQNGGVFRALPGSTLRATDDGAVRGTGGAWENEGEFLKDNADGSLGPTLFADDAFFRNRDRVTVRRGTLRLESSGENDELGVFRLEDRLATVEFASAGARLFTMNSIGGTIRGPGFGHIRGGTVVVPSGQTLEAENFRVTAGVLRGPGHFAADVLEWDGGTLTGLRRDSAGQNVRVDTMLDMNGTLIKTLDNTELDQNGEARWRGSGWLALRGGAVFNNRGNFTLISDGVALTCDFDNTAPALHNHPGGRMHFIGEHVSFSGNSGRWANDGAVTMAADLINVSVPFEHCGTFQFTDDGVLALLGGGRSSGTFQTFAGSTVRVAGAAYVFEQGTALSGPGLLELVSAGVTVPAGARVPVSCNARLLGGAISGEGELEVSGPTFDWLGGAMQNSGATIVSGGTVFSIRGAAPKTLTQRTLDLATPRAEFADSGGLALSQGARLRIRPGGALTARSTNGATLSISGPGEVSNDGELSVQTPLQIQNNATFINRQIATLGADLTGGGGGDFTGGRFTGAGRLVLSGGTFVFSNTDVVTQGDLVLNGGTAAVNGDSHAAGARLTPLGIVEGPAALTLDLLGWEGGVMRGSGSTTVAFLSLRGPGGKTLQQRTLNITGASEWLDGNLTASAGAVINNRGGIDITANDSLFAGSGGATINNFGALARTGAPGQTTTIFPPFNHRAGLVRAQSGVLRFAGPFNQSGGVLRCDLGAVLRFDAGLNITGGRFAGAGVANGNVTVRGGVVRPGTSPGTLTLEGNYTQEPGATLEIEISGPAPGSGHDVLIVTNSANVGGALAVNLIDDFRPAPEQSFVIVQARTITGQFANAPHGQRVATIDGYGSFVVHYTPTNVLLASFQLNPNPPPTAPAVLRPPVLSFDGSLELSLTGTPGRSYVLETSTNLLHWLSFQTNNAGFDGQLVLELPAMPDPTRFFRALGR
jgi:hypothetical protein